MHSKLWSERGAAADSKLLQKRMIFMVIFHEAWEQAGGGPRRCATVFGLFGEPAQLMRGTGGGRGIDNVQGEGGRKGDARWEWGRAADTYLPRRCCAGLGIVGPDTLAGQQPYCHWTVS